MEKGEERLGMPSLALMERAGSQLKRGHVLDSLLALYTQDKEL